jgi:2,3-dihydroxybiphenyl 1,2-dioxygenase
MNHQLELGYVVIEVPDPDTLSPVLADVVGLVPGEGAHAWRNDGRARRVVIAAGPRNDVVALGIEAVDEAVFTSTVARLGATEDPDAAADRRVARLARAAAPWGGDVEVVLGLADAPTPFSSALVPGGFLTDGVGFGHVVLATTAFDESVSFLTDGLGFEQSDWLEMELAPGIDLQVRFFHCNARHHTVALARAPFELPQTLHHVMFEMQDRDDVGAAFDRLWATDLGIPNGLGRHDNDGMFSFYLQTPAGFQIEVGHGARVIAEGWDDNRMYDAISAWGHQPLRPA